MPYGHESFGQAVRRGFRMMPAALRAILVLTALTFLLQLLGLHGLLVRALGFSPDPGVAASQPWRWVTYMLVHGGFWHVLFNLLWLWWFGRELEQLRGASWFGLYYVLCGLGGALLYLLLEQASLLLGRQMSQSLMIGASGAVYGVMVAFARYHPDAPIMLLFLPPIPARFFVAGLIALDVLLLSAGAMDGVARAAHLGGALTGWLLLRLEGRLGALDRGIRSWLYRRQQRRRQREQAQRFRTQIEDARIVRSRSGQRDPIDQATIDRILDKISERGYEALTEEEKRILFEASRRR
ncbi:MAG: rhomboid family intramembrane serine protease [Bacteroidetes bacterium]|nr:rhomboid family intramembrane serine protease [Rhodothermia bacterium]MCS7154350.1 rhomboid family intramembrane serine protease [Bacteroidota bacterium]MCX7906613.1 rhomboid family intramembrane serine protease [Bacteroidota bacterium]MDW8137106.1 rhomboid family intramembrane serine protease [Bacteroidota bacterium]MDW8285023.1 rhomboid family intramembrane serine protease [Bacteroidota bacterium]